MFGFVRNLMVMLTILAVLPMDGAQAFVNSEDLSMYGVYEAWSNGSDAIHQSIENYVAGVQMGFYMGEYTISLRGGGLPGIFCNPANEYAVEVAELTPEKILVMFGRVTGDGAKGSADVAIYRILRSRVDCSKHRPAH